MCNILWESTYVTRLIRIMTFLKYRQGSSPLFLLLALLSIYELNFYQISIFMHSFLHGNLPSVFNDYSSRNDTIQGFGIIFKVQGFHTNLQTSLYNIASQIEMNNDNFSSRVQIKPFIRVATFLQHIPPQSLISSLSAFSQTIFSCCSQAPSDISSPGDKPTQNP